jgi:hypothetical protein
VGVGVGLAFVRAFAFACHVHAQGKNLQGTCTGAFSLAAASLGELCCTLLRAQSPRIMCKAVARLIPRKRHTKLTAFVARLWNAQWRQLVLSLCVWGTPFSGCRGFRGFIAENLRHCIQRCYCSSSRGALHHSKKQQGPTFKKHTSSCKKYSNSFFLSQVKLILSPKQRAKPAASRTRICTNAAVCIASGECPSRF